MNDLVEVFNRYIELCVDSVGVLEDTRLPYMAPEAIVLESMEEVFTRVPTEGTREEMFSELSEVEFCDIEIDMQDFPGDTEFSLTYEAPLGLWVFSYSPGKAKGLQVEGSSLDEVVKAATTLLKGRLALAMEDYEGCTEDLDQEMKLYIAVEETEDEDG